MRRSCRYEAYIPDPLNGRPVLFPPDVAEDISRAEQAISELNTENPSIVSLEAVARLFLRAEAVGSSRIEGLEVGARRLLRAEAARSLGEPMNDITAETVLGNIEAMRIAVDQLAAKEQITIDDLLNLHSALMRHTTSPAHGGHIRTTQNWIGGSDFNPCQAEFVPPPPDNVPALLEDLIAYLNGDEHPPLVQAAMAHLQFETIHPFSDGNGRVGRALIHVILRHRGLSPRYVPPISLVLATHSRDYVNGLTVARYIGEPHGREALEGLARWLRVFAVAALSAAADATVYGRMVDDLVRRWRDQAAPVRSDSTADILLRILPSAPITTVATAARLTGRSVQSANLAVKHLVNTGVLVPVRAVRWRQAYEAAGLLDMLT
ncbi:MAG: Fic family protein, partial [Chloroflexota bacterium]